MRNQRRTVRVCRAWATGAVLVIMVALAAAGGVSLSAATASATGAQTGGSGASTTTTRPPAATATTATTVATTTTLAPGAKKKMLVVGDSVMKGIEAFGGLPVLKAALADYDITFDAVESRSTVGGQGVIVSHNPAQFDTVVISLGANDAGSPEVFRARAKRVLDLLQPNAHVFWLNVHEVGHYAAEYKASNVALAQLAASYPNTQIVDWNAFANSLPPGQLAADGLHLSNASAVAMANLIADSVKGTSPFSHSMATTTTAPTIPTTAAPTAVPTTARTSSSGSDNSNGVVIGIVVGAVLLVVFIISAYAGRRRAKARRREERKARLDAMFGGTTAAATPSGPGEGPTASAEPAAPLAENAAAGNGPTESEAADQTGADESAAVGEAPATDPEV